MLCCSQWSRNGKRSKIFISGYVTQDSVCCKLWTIHDHGTQRNLRSLRSLTVNWQSLFCRDRNKFTVQKTFKQFEQFLGNPSTERNKEIQLCDNQFWASHFQIFLWELSQSSLTIDRDSIYNHIRPTFLTKKVNFDTKESLHDDVTIIIWNRLSSVTRYCRSSLKYAFI